MFDLIRLRGLPVIAGSILVLLGLLTLEWVTNNALGQGMSTSGMLTGLAMAAVMLALYAARPEQPWTQACNAVAKAITEVAIAAAVVYALAGASVVLLPSFAARLQQSDRDTDLILYTVLGLGLLVAGRAWRRSLVEQAAANTALNDTAIAKAALALKEKALLESEMLVLRAQIEPHFLWNTLGQLQYLVTKDPDQAARMTAHLIGFLRSTVPSEEGRESTLGTEVGAVCDYLEIMKIRMGPRLGVSVDVPPSLLDMSFPPRLLQTLVENAIKHGLEPKIGPVEVMISAGERLLEGIAQTWIEVRDTGVGLHHQAATKGTGIGLRNVRDRLQLAYGDCAALTLTSCPEGGVNAVAERKKRI